MLCWSCQREAGSGAFCAACGALQPANDAADAFTVLGLPARYGVDLTAAEAAYKELSRQVHPDRFATADPRARRASLARTVQLNQAWLTIKDPLRRAGYLLERAGIYIGSDSQKSAMGGSGVEDKRTAEVSAPPAFLLEIIELHEELRAARRAGDTVKVAFMAEEIRGRATQAMSGIAEALDSGERPQLEKAARQFMAMRYYQRFLDEALADAGGGHGP
jgi:molecular chaperone HscB